MKLERARGTRDFAAEDTLLRQQIVTTLRSVFELYGYNPLETPIIERFETLASKYAGGEEILKETFKLKDQGGRELGLRYDLTVPMCRFIATNPNLKMPFKRYQIGEVFRDGPLKTGRYREFVQCDVDIVGVKSINAEIELLALTYEIFKKLGLNAEIRVNSRKISNAILEIVNAPKETEKRNEYLILFDKKEKMPAEEFKKELKRYNVVDRGIVTLFTSTSKMELKALKEYTKEILTKWGKFENSEYAEGFEEMEEVLSVLKDSGVSNVVFDGTLARGLSYYTGTVFEVFLKDSEISSAVAAGGRYDKMIGNFVGSGREYPAVGISFGLDVIEDALGVEKKERKKTTTLAYVIPIKAVAESKKIASQLRKKGINTDIDLSCRDVKKNLEYAAAAGIPYVVFVGEKEVKEGKVKLRNLKTGREESITISECSKYFK